MRLLLVEDDPRIVRFLRKGLTEEAYALDAVATGADALFQASVGSYDAVILDAIIPPPDGFEVCRRLREEGNRVPILMLTARDAVADRVEGLDAGADDYLVKPFQFDELLARLRALLRRGGATVSTTLRVGGLELDTRARRARIAGELLELTTKEYALLEYFARNAGRVLGREEIAEHVWDDAFDPFSNLIEVYVNRLRRNIEKISDARYIHTVRGAGYILEERRD
jgi:DNA-binding response OmpR family regulator